MLKVAQAAFTVACSKSCQKFLSAWVNFEWLYFPWTSSQLVINHHMTGWWGGHGLISCFVCYVELQIAQPNAIWLFSVCMKDYPATMWLPTTPTLHPHKSACGIGVVSKKLSKMAGSSASYSFNSWCIDRLWIAIDILCGIMVNCTQPSIFLPKIYTTHFQIFITVRLRWPFLNPVIYM